MDTHGLYTHGHTPQRLTLGTGNHSAHTPHMCMQVCVHTHTQPQRPTPCTDTQAHSHTYINTRHRYPRTHKFTHTHEPWRLTLCTDTAHTHAHIHPWPRPPVDAPPTPPSTRSRCSRTRSGLESSPMPVITQVLAVLQRQSIGTGSRPGADGLDSSHTSGPGQ